MEAHNSALIVSAFIQLALFSLAPFLWWAFTARKTAGFLAWIGLKKPEVPNKKSFALWILGSVLLIIASALLLPLVADGQAATAQFAGQGSRLLLGALAYGFIQTGLSEEILFRGFSWKTPCK